MPYRFPRCRILPLPDFQVALQIDGDERLRWHFAPHYPRPFFYPLLGPSGASLTRMGHPGAANHDHHRSVWFAHHDAMGVDFWSDGGAARIRQKHWLAYEDGDDEAVMAVALGWYDGHDPKELLEQELVAAVRPGEKGETLLELQATFRPAAEQFEFGQTNFGFLAVRVAKSISAYFGGGELTSSEGERGEANIFGKAARWMDYSGPVPSGDPAAEPPHEGITYFDHPDNPGHPAHWHVREDGWMGASPCMNAPLAASNTKPLVLRYLLHAHRGDIDPARTNKLAEAFANSPGFKVEKATVRHRQFSVDRLDRVRSSGQQLED